MSLRLVRSGYTLSPADGLAEEALERIKEGVPYEYAPKRDRSTKQHRLYFAMISLVVQNLDQPTTKKALHSWLKLRCGLASPVYLKNQQVEWVPDSVAFDRLSQDDFSAYFERSTELICSTIIPGMTREDLLLEARRMLGLSQ